MSTVVPPAAIAPRHRTRITGRDLALGIGTGLGLAVATAIATSLIARAAAPRWAHTEGLTVLIVAEVYLMVIAGLLIAVRSRAGAARLLALRRPRARHVWSALALAVAATAAGLAVSLAFSPLSGGPAATLHAIVRDTSDEAKMPTATPLVWALILIRILALTGTAEEMLFRGALHGWLRRRFSAPATIALTTTLFALEHSYYPILLPPVVIYGVALGWLRHRSHTITTTIVMHVTVDFAAFLAAVVLA